MTYLKYTQTAVRAKIPVLQMQGLIKLIESVVYERGYVQANLIFIDYASVLERGWEDLSPYVFFNVAPLSINNLAEVVVRKMEADDIPTIG